MDPGTWSALEWLALIEYELLLFAGVFFLLGAIDEFAVDAIWLWLRVTGRLRTARCKRSELAGRALQGHAAVLIPAWDENPVVEHTIAHMRHAWPQEDLRIFVGTYRNDSASAKAALRGAGGDQRVRIVVIERDGPTTKADCLNCLFETLREVEAQTRSAFRLVLLHDAEDMVDAAALPLIDAAMDDADFVQVPVLALPQKNSRWIGSHYVEEFAESHAKSMVVRSYLGAGLPAAGVGCAFAREILDRMARRQDDPGPFADDSLTEDYELGIKVGMAGGRSTFLRVRGDDGKLIATRSYFPSSLGRAVRQKARWMHGIAFQGWERLGWGRGPGEWWMRLRDRRGPLSAIVLLAGYLLLLFGTIHLALDGLGFAIPWQLGDFVRFLIVVNLVSLVWRALMRFAFTTREFGAGEGLRAVLRLPVSNIISIMAGRRALFSYAGTLGGKRPVWDKTSHYDHPALATVIRPGT